MNEVLQRAWKTRIHPSRLALAINITFVVVNSALLLPQAAYAASSAPIHFSVRAGSLEQGLLTLARQSQQTLSFNPERVAPYQAKPIDGNFTLEQAIAHQLQGTPLSVTKTANGTLTIDAVATAMPTPSASDLQAAKDSGQTLPTITVIGRGDQSEDATVYNPSTSSSATRTDLSLQETAQSVQVLSRKLLDDRQAVSVEDALRNLGGVTVQSSNRGGNTVYIRGFNVTGGSTDGVSNPNNTINGSATGYSSIDGIERVEVLKGPQAVLAGNSSPAGSVNVVRKAPTADPLHTYKFEVSKYGEVKNAIDLGGPLNDDKTFRYRFNASTMRADNSFPDFNGKRGEYVAPVLAWVTDETQLKVGAEFNTGRTSGPAATIYSNGRIQRPAEYRLGDKDNHFAINAKTAYYELNQNIVGDWSFNSKATYLDNTMNYRLHEIYGASANGTLINHELANKQDLNSISLQNDIRGKIALGPMTHNVLVGYDYQRAKTTSWDLYSGKIYTTANYYDPDSISFPAIPDPTYRSYTMLQYQKGLILQDQIDLWERLHFQVSFKQAKWLLRSTTGTTTTKTVEKSVTQWVPSYGVSYDITPEITAYANLLHSFATVGTVNTQTGEQLDPSTGKSKEIGLKFSLLDDNLTITTAAFHIEQKNVVVTDITGNAIGAEGRETKGFDFDLNGQILPGWNILASYTFAQPKDADNSSVTGSIYQSRVTGQPKHTGSLWTTYELQSGRLQGLGAGFGVQAASDTWNGSTNNYFKIGGWAQTDASVFYHQPKYTVTLGVNNLFDRELYSYSSTANYIGVKPGRTARLSVTYSF